MVIELEILYLEFKSNIDNPDNPDNPFVTNIPRVTLRVSATGISLMNIYIHSYDNPDNPDNPSTEHELKHGQAGKTDLNTQVITLITPITLITLSS